MILINTNDISKKMIINRALNISNDRIEEVIGILEMLNNPNLTKDDIKGIAYYITGYSFTKQKQITEKL